MDITGLTEEFVQRSAVNASALANARKIATKDDFSGRKITADQTLIYGDCKGSGKEPYHTSVDLSGETVVSRCSCPSRQIPCKHALALMLDYANGKQFDVGEVPEDVARKREKIEKRAEKAKLEATGEAPVMSKEEAQKAAKKKKASSDLAARKKIARQLEGLALLSDFSRDMLSAGLGTVNSSTIVRYKDLAKQLGDYYLNGPQLLLQRFILAAQADGGDERERELVKCLIRLDQVAKKGKAWLEKQLETEEFGPQNDILYEEMGGIWRLDQLDALGMYQDDAELVQLSFAILWDEAAQSEIDTGYWIDMKNGVISKTENIRPVKAKKYVHADDSAFESYRVKRLYYYPGGMNKRIRWENALSEPCGQEIPLKILALARKDLAASVKEAKNELKNTLSDEAVAMLIAYDRLTFTDVEGATLWQGEEAIAIRTHKDYDRSLRNLCFLPKRYRKAGALFGEIRYSEQDRTIYMVPVALVTKSELLRLV